MIGQGAIGLVFLAEDTQLSRPVALKVIRPELAGTSEVRDRFVREAQATTAIKHDHIVTIYQVGRDGQTQFLAMEYLKGMSLQSWLERGRKPSIDLVLRLAREIASGLAAAHRNGLIHRDIKPANLWLEAPNGRVKILDFGMARSDRDEVQITHVGTVMGTPAYMSPEQARGEIVGASSDRFSLGCVLYRLCSGCLHGNRRRDDRDSCSRRNAAVRAPIRSSEDPPGFSVEIPCHTSAHHLDSGSIQPRNPHPQVRPEFRFRTRVDIVGYPLTERGSRRRWNWRWRRDRAD